MDVLCWGTYDTGKPRWRILRDGLVSIGATVRECHADVWEGIDDKSQVRNRGRRLRLLGRWLARYPALVWRFLREPHPDLVLVGYPGIVDVVVLAPFAHLRGVPVVWDMFLSLYDTVVLDRRIIRPGSLGARLLRWLEGFAIRRPSVVFLDTQAHARRIEALYELPAGSCAAVWVGAEIDHFRRSDLLPSTERLPGTPLKALFYGQFIPLHGIDTIVAAARLTAEDGVEWTLIGSGQEAPSIRRMLHDVPLPKVHWIEKADICLGIFGTSNKAAAVIPNKVFQAVAAGKPLITRDSPAIRELLVPAPPCVYLVWPGDASALAGAVRQHLHHLAAAAAVPCHRSLLGTIGAPAIGRQFVEAVAPRMGRAGWVDVR
jgi:glycosyltransferase involved in cell wall biosynthesis